MGHQSYVLLCNKITTFLPSEGELSEKLGTIFSRLKNFQNPSCYILEKINENYNKKKFGYHDALHFYMASKLCTVM
jgi:hypothetical protein